MVWREGGVWIWPTFVVAASFNDAPSSTLPCHFHPNPLSHALALLVSGPDKCKNHANYRNMRKHTPQLLATLPHKSCQSQKKKHKKTHKKKRTLPANQRTAAKKKYSINLEVAASRHKDQLSTAANCKTSTLSYEVRTWRNRLETAAAEAAAS